MKMEHLQVKSNVHFKHYLYQDQDDEEEFLVSKHHTLLQQLSEQQHELRRLENKQKELIQLKMQAESRLAAANETAARTIKVCAICAIL